MKQILIVSALFLFFIQNTEAQFFKKLKNRIGQKIEQKVEDKLVEELSEEIANRAVKPMYSAFDDMFRESYKEQYGKEYDDSEYEGDPEKQAAMMQSILGSMYGNVELPDQYQFDYIMKIKLTDYGEKKSHEMTMYINPTDGLFAMKMNGKKGDQIMVFDINDDQVVIFNDKDKTAMAMPNVMKIASAFGSHAIEDGAGEMIKFERINKTKKVIGYKSQGYKYESEEDQGEFYVTTELPFDWTDAFGGLVDNISPNFYKENPGYDIKGMLMYAKTKRKDGGDESKWEVIDFSTKGMTINCAEYKLANMMGGK